MEQTPFIEPQLGSPAPKRSHKKLIITITAIVVLLAVVGIVAAVLLGGGKKEAQKQDAEKPVVAKEFKITNAAQPIMYGGYKVYDACSLISYDTIRKNVEGYQSLLDTVGTDEYPSDPLSIVHNYVDRDIASPLGKDGQPHQTSKAIGGSGTDKLNASNFVGGSDSSCLYGQGEGLEIGRGQTFAKVYVNQLPTPVSSEFLAYINSLTKTVSEAGIDIYVEPERDSSGFATVIFVTADKKTVVVAKFGPEKLAAPLGDDMVKFLSAGPVGPMHVEYPKPWDGLKDPCTLISAAEFQQFTGKPADSMAEDVATLTQVDEGLVMRRSCERIEVERLDRSEISSAMVTVRMAKDINGAKSYVNKAKKGDGEREVIVEVPQALDGVDDKYVRVSKLLDKVRDYEFEVRVGQAILTVKVKGETGLDASADAFIARMLPVVKTVVANWKK